MASQALSPSPPLNPRSSLGNDAEIEDGTRSISSHQTASTRSVRRRRTLPDNSYIRAIDSMVRYMNHLQLLRGPFRLAEAGAIHVLGGTINHTPSINTAPLSVSSAVLPTPSQPSPTVSRESVEQSSSGTISQHPIEVHMDSTIFEGAAQAQPSSPGMPSHDESDIEDEHAASQMEASSSPNSSVRNTRSHTLPKVQPYQRWKYTLDRHESIMAELQAIGASGQTFGPRITTTFIIEDLCPQLLEIVGQVFEFPPAEIFARHMYKANHNLYPSKEPPSEWVTADVKKPFATIQWYRPVYLRKELLDTDLPSRILENFQTTRESEEQTSMPEEETVLEPLMAFGQRRVKTVRKRFIALSNIYRYGIPISATNVPDKTTKQPFLWEERATIFFKQSSRGQRNVLMLLDPLPRLRDGDDPNSRVELAYIPTQKQRHAHRLLPSFADAPSVMLELNRTHSTAADLCAPFKNMQNSADVLDALATVILKDCKSAFDLISDSLEEITRLSMDDLYLQEQLSHWRTLMFRMQKEVQALPKQFRYFIQDVYEAVPEHILRLEKDLIEGTDQIVKAIAECQNGLRADLSILESRRGIAEAESVANLTELAFIFIPLSFVASLFSMQVNELESGVPVVAFVQAAIICITLIYSVRLMIRGEPFKRAKQAILRDARRRYKIKRNDSIPTSTFVKFLIRWIFFGDRGEVLAYWLLISAIGISIIPVVLIWERGLMDRSFRVAMSLVLVPTGLVMAWLVTSFLLPDNKSRWIVNAFVRWADKTVRRRYQRRSRATAGAG